MRIGNRRFAPSLWPSIATALVLPLFVMLGVWQLQRAEQKADLFSVYLARATSEPLRALSPTTDTTKHLWRKVELHGRFRSEPMFLLDNQVMNRKPGYFVYNILSLENNISLLVNRGWVQANSDRSVLPALSVPAKEVTIQGLIKTEPSTGILLADNTEESFEGGVVRLQKVDINELNSSYALNLPGFIVRLSVDSESGYIRDWPKPGSGREKHLGYAFQWFAMAAAILAIFIAVNLKKE